MRRLMIGLVCVVCLSFGLQVQAQDEDYYGNLAQEFLKAYFSVQDPSQYADVLPLPLDENFEKESVFCSDVPPTEFELLPINDFPEVESFLLVKRLRTDQGVLYVAFREYERFGNVIDVVQQVVCEDSAAGQAFKAFVTNKVLCGQADPAYLWIEGHWLNRDGTRALFRFHSMFRGQTTFVYLKQEGESWAFDKGLCNYDADGQALSLITEYMYDYPDAFYFMGSVDTPIFADVTSVRGGYDTGQATILIQLETLSQNKSIQDDPVCMLNLRLNPGWMVYETRCVSE